MQKLRKTSTREHMRLPILILIVAAALFLRLVGLDTQSIWYDEGLSIFYAQNSLPDLIRGAAGSDHPPLHALLLHGWIRCAGASEFSVRFFSAWWNVLTVALLYRLSKRLVGPMAGMLASLLLALSPFAIWFSQETRGYTLALALVVATADLALSLFPRVLGLHRRLPGASWFWYVGYAIVAAAALYTHFYSGFVLFALNLAYLLWWIVPAGPRRPGRFWAWMAAQVGVLILFAPWVPVVYTQLGHNATYWHGAVHWKEILGETLRALSVGKTLDNAWATGAVWVLGMLAVLGTLSLCWQRRDRLIAFSMWLWISIPTIVMIVIAYTTPKFSPRYLFNIQPALLLLAGAGGQWLWRLSRRYRLHFFGWTALGVSAMILGGATARSLDNHYWQQDLYRPDMRALVRYIEDEATDNDVIVLVGGYIYPAFDYYYEGDLPVIPLPDKLLPTTREPVEPGMLAQLNEAFVDRQQLWLVLWQPGVSDPTGLISDAIEQTYHRMGVGREFHGMALMRFDVSPGPLLRSAPDTVQDAEFGDQVRLLGYDLPVAAVKPGDTVYLYLYWQAMRPLDDDYKVFTQLIDEQGHIVAQHDQIAGAAEFPTSHWPPDRTIRSRFLLTVDAQAPPGRYRLISGFYNPGKETRLPAQGEGAAGDYVVLALLEIE